MTSITMSDEQFQQLLARLSVGNQNPTQVASAQNGNFTGCLSRFDGAKISSVQAFIDSVSIYKDCAQVSDENALKGLPMLLDGFAAEWYQGVKATISTWKEAIDLLKLTFGPQKPAYRVYRELFANEQDESTPTDIFVCKARSTLAQLPNNTLTEETQLDMVYGLLHRRIREKLSRNKINNFNELLSQARLVEETFERTDSRNEKTNVHADKDKRPRCLYCRNFGHVKDDCRKLKKTQSADSRNSVPQPTASSNVAVFQKEPKKNDGIACYGCGNPGYIRSNCPKCSPKKNEDDHSVMSTEFLCNTINHESPSTRPLVPISIHHHNGYAYLDTGAKSSVAGSALAQLLLKENIPYIIKNDLEMTLADGIRRKVTAHIFDIEIIFHGRSIPIEMLAVPEHQNSRTLLGVDFIHKANVILDIPNKTYFFGENPHECYNFTAEESVSLVSVNTVTFSQIILRDEEGSSLQPEERKNLNSLLQENHTVFESSNEPTPYAEHCIVLTDDNPIAVPPYRMSEPKKIQLKNELDKLLENGTIEECDSPYAAPVVLVPKKDDGIRLTVDYRKLNAVTRPCKYPLPRIDDLLHEAKKTNYMTTLDLKSGYHQVNVKASDRDKTSFITPFGTYRYIRMPFGLSTAPSTFQKLMDRFKSGIPEVLLLAYLDDLIVISSSFEEHLADLQKVFKRLNTFKLKLNRKKCFFCCKSVRYLGHIISPEGVQPDDSKVEAIMKMTPPKNVKQLLSFLQTCSWFRRFIHNFAEVSKPLSMLTKKNATWNWKLPQQEAFDQLKVLLSSAPILRQADTKLPYILRTDASSYALGACLLQGEGADERPVEYASRLLTTAEQNYTTTEREALAIVWAIQKFRGYVEGATILVQSDHQPLRWLMSLKTPTGRLARWALSLQAFDLHIDYITGKKNVIADTLSRPVLDESPDSINMISVDMPSKPASDVRAEQLEDPELRKIITDLESSATSTDFKKWAERGYIMSNGILFRYNPDIDEEEPQQVIPSNQIPHILREYHDLETAGHYGIERTYQRIARRYYWMGMRRNITDYVGQCIECKRYKPTNLKPAGLLQTPIQAQRFEVISIDLFGPLPETPDGCRWIFIVEDTASRWTELFPLKTATAEACARCLTDEIILRYGVPRRIISDNGVQFVGTIMQQLAHCLGFKQCLTPVYHPESNPVERKNRDLKTQLAILTSDDHTSWIDKLPAVRFSMNTVKCQSTGYTAAFLTFGRELRTPDDVHRDMRVIVQTDNFVPQITPYLLTLSNTLHEARENHEKNQDRRTNIKNEHRRPYNYSVGDKVLVTTHVLSKASNQFTSKFAPRRDGPYLIQKIVSPTTYILSSTDKPDQPLGKYHTSALTPYQISEERNLSPLQPLRNRGRPPKLSSDSSHTPKDTTIPQNDSDSVEQTPTSAEDSFPAIQPKYHPRKKIQKKCICCSTREDASVVQRGRM